MDSLSAFLCIGKNSWSALNREILLDDISHQYSCTNMHHSTIDVVYAIGSSIALQIIPLLQPSRQTLIIISSFEMFRCVFPILWESCNFKNQSTMRIIGVSNHSVPPWKHAKICLTHAFASLSCPKCGMLMSPSNPYMSSPCTHGYGIHTMGPHVT